MITRDATGIVALIHTESATMDTLERVDKLVSFANNYRGVRSVQRITRDDKPYTRLIIKGTEHAMRILHNVIQISGLEAPPNSDHDHQSCIDRARSMGVPESWAHTPETYLSM